MDSKLGLTDFFPDIPLAQNELGVYGSSLAPLLENKLAAPVLFRMKNERNSYEAMEILFLKMSCGNPDVLDIVVKFAQSMPDLKKILAPQFRNGLSVLSLDGGGFRGYVTLLILEDLMKKIAGDAYDDDKPLRPCKVFDLICGTSTGGLIAILLGRLGMSCLEALEAYAALGPMIFGDDEKIKGILMKGSRFDEKSMEDMFKMLVKNKTGDPNALMKDEQPGDHCYTFVTTVNKANPSPPSPPHIRSYSSAEMSPPPIGHKWTIVQAARATSAAPTYFPPLALSKPPYPDVIYQDAGGSGFNNPAMLANHELGRIKEFRGRTVQAFVSLGTGLEDLVPSKAPTMQQKEESKNNALHAMWGYVTRTVNAPVENMGMIKGLVDTLVNVATDSNRIDFEVQTELNKSAPESYFRWNPSQGLGSIGLADINQINTMQEIANNFLKQNQTSICKCAKLLQPIAQGKAGRA